MLSVEQLINKDTSTLCYAYCVIFDTVDAIDYAVNYIAFRKITNLINERVNYVSAGL